MASYLTDNLHVRTSAPRRRAADSARSSRSSNASQDRATGLKQLETSCFGLLSRCAKTVSESHLLRVPGLLSSEEQIPQIVVNVRSWRETMETLEEMTLLHTQEVTGSSPVAPTIRINNLQAVRLTSYGPRRRSENLSPVESAV